MHRIDAPSATPELKFTEGSPAGGVAATTVTAAWLNDVQEELLSILGAAGITPVKGDQDQVLEAIRVLTALAPGTVQAFALVAAPVGWLKCNGATVSRATYSSLFAAIGTTFGAGDGVTTFKLPDLRGEFIRGLDDGRGVDTGRALGSAQAGEILSHTHRDLFFAGGGAAGGTPNPGTAFSKTYYASGSSNFDGTGSAAGLTSAATGGSETRPRNIALLHCIKY